MNRRERRAAARKVKNTSNNISAGTPAALFESSLNHLKAGRYLDAQICCQQLLAADAAHAGALHLMGILSLQAKQYDHAVEWICRAIQQDPNPDYYSNLGVALQRLGRHEEARQALDKAVQLNPDSAEFRANLGNALQNLGRTTDAFTSFQDALKLDPRHWRAAARSGAILYQWKRFEEALAHLDLCDALQPNHAPTLQTRALSLRGLKRHQEYLAESRRAHALDPDNAEIVAHIGEALQLLGRYEESLEWVDRLLKLRPNDLEALKTKAYSLAQLLRIDEATATNNHIKTIDPGNTAADWNLSLLQILEGNFEAGWAGREVRWRIPELSSAYPKFVEPMWLGEQSVEGKTILVHIDEGQGDAIQFVRYVPMLAERGARIILVVDGSLHSLLSGLPGVSQCFKRPAATLPPFDFHCPLTSLPIPFGTRLDNIPAPACYLPEPPSDRVQAWKDRLGPHDRLRVGLVWSGNPNHFNDLNRSIPLRMFARLLGVDATFVSLQKEPRPADKAVLSEFGDIIDLTAHFTDFADTAALVRCLDLVIAVDTSVAHLAAALGCPTWMLLPYAPDHRWMLNRNDSPWYPTMQLFRQTESRDYAPVIARIREELLQLIAASADRGSRGPMTASR